MKGRLWWSVVLSMMVLATLVFVTAPVASAQSGPRIVSTGPAGTIDYSPRTTVRRPGLINPLCGLAGGPAIGSSDCDSQTGREWEGTASTDYYTFEPNPGLPPNPDIAVGPDDIVTVVNRRISRYPNPNAPTFNNNGGTAPVQYATGGSYLFPPTSANFLDVWIGEGALNELCPTQPRSNLSCVIDNAVVRYDQLQGRFVVLFSVVDTGLVSCSGCAGTPSQTNRKSSWVIIASRWATGCDGKYTLAGGAASCTGPANAAVPGGVGTTEFFTQPQPPGPSQASPNSGGVSSNWFIYYGSPDGLCPSGGCPYGNMNRISDLVRGKTAPVGARTIDCAATSIGNSALVCYFPSSARLGFDNDNIIVVSSVYDDNVPLASRGLAAGGLTPAWEGTRIRAFKKAAIYSGLTSVAGSSSTTLVAGAANWPSAQQLQGDWYDLWGDSVTPYSVDKVVTQTLATGTQVNLLGLNYEPAHLRGRALATYSGNGNLDNGFTNLLGSVSMGPLAGANLVPQTVLYLRTITFTRTVPGTLAINLGSGSAIVNLPALQGGIPALSTSLQTVVVPAFYNPQSVTQRDKLQQIVSGNQAPTGSPYLYVGDDRPHRVIAREGHLYDARVGYQTDLYRFDPTANTQASTVIYDVIQKLGAGTPALEILNTTWGNGLYYAPMYDVPANVIQYGSVSPVNMLPYLEKLFVGTTFPPLSPSDPRTFNYGNISAPSLAACKGQEPGVTSTSGALAFPGLFDMRCGEDAYDTFQAVRHPVTGAYTPGDFQLRTQPTQYVNQIVPFGLRGGAATDVNNMGLWLYGTYGKGRLASVPGYGQWGTYLAHYPLTFPIRDPYNNLQGSYPDVGRDNSFYTYIQIAKQTEIDPGSRTSTQPFGVNNLVTRAEMARWVMRSQMNEGAVTAYLNSTGGIYCSFADVTCPGNTGTVTDTTGIQGDWRYIETMWRRGYTKGCQETFDGQRRFCPQRNLTRGEMSVFIIRAKMNSVFPTVTSGAGQSPASCQPVIQPPIGQPGGSPTVIGAGSFGDLFGLYYGCTPYFTDVPTNHPYFGFIQKMRELRITNGRTLTAAGSTFDPEANLTRGELMVFLVRGFFP